MRKHLASFLLASAILSGPALAADMAVKAPVVPPVPFTAAASAISRVSPAQSRENWTARCLISFQPNCIALSLN